jgi:hypothetical protein
MDEQILSYKIRIESTSQSSQTKPTLTFSDLPEELYHELLLWLDWKDMLIMEQLNHSWLFRASNRFYWKRFCELLLNVELLDDIDSQYNWKIIFKELYFQRGKLEFFILTSKKYFGTHSSVCENILTLQPQKRYPLLRD